MPRKAKSGYDGWLVSDSLWKRSLAVYGHNLIGGILVMAAVVLSLGLIFIIFFLAGKVAEMVVPLF